MVYGAVKKLVEYGLDTGLITEVDRIYATNQILDVLKLDDYEDTDISGEEIRLEQVLAELMDMPMRQVFCLRIALPLGIYLIPA